MMIKKI